MTRQGRLIRHFLLYAYPAAWRREYGEELVSLLALRPLRFQVAADVALHGLARRLKSDLQWKIVGAALFLWTLLCLVRNTIAPLSPAAYAHIFRLFNLASLFVGCWTVLREPASLRDAALAALKAALVGTLPELMSEVLWAIDILHPTVLNMHSSPQIRGAGVTLLFVRTDAAAISPLSCLYLLLGVTIIQGLLLGYMGALAGHCVAAIRSSYRSRPASRR